MMRIVNVQKVKYISVHYRRLFLIMLTTLLVMFFYGCEAERSSASISQEPISTNTEEKTPEEAYKENPAAYVVFDQSWEPTKTYVSVQEVMDYETQYPDCHGTWFRDQLSGEDLCIYNAYLYAMEHCFTGFELYVEDNDRDFSYIRESVSMDSPFLEQNTYLYGENIRDRPTDYIGESIYVMVNQFTQERWALKMEALEKCKEIVAGIPAECDTQLEKMEYLYRYVCDHVEYTGYEDAKYYMDKTYLYDAVCKGETNCDGYSNMLNLLFNLIGVESYEVMGYNPDEPGHTWVIANIDGTFYNFDPTYEDTDGGYRENTLLYFGFSDELITLENLCRDEVRPQCTDNSRDFAYVDLIVENLDSVERIEEIAQLTDERARNGEYITVIAIRNLVTESECKSFLNQYISYVSEIKTVHIALTTVGDCSVLDMKTEPR